MPSTAQLLPDSLKIAGLLDIHLFLFFLMINIFSYKMVSLFKKMCL